MATDPNAPKVFVEAQAQIHNLTDTATGRVYEPVPEFEINYNATNVHTYHIVPDDVAAAGEAAIVKWRAEQTEPWVDATPEEINEWRAGNNLEPLPLEPAPVLDAPIQHDP